MDARVAAVDPEFTEILIMIWRRYRQAREGPAC
jgi:hypothetical protein